MTTNQLLAKTKEVHAIINIDGIAPLSFWSELKATIPKKIVHTINMYGRFAIHNLNIIPNPYTPGVRDFLNIPKS